MPPNSKIKDTIVIGGLTLLGYMAGGKLGSMFGAVIGTVVCSLLNVGDPSRLQEPREETHRFTPYERLSTNRRQNVKKSKNEPCELPKCSICLEPFKASIVLLPCSHMCFCDECYEKVKSKNVTKCPICREGIDNFMLVYPS